MKIVFRRDSGFCRWKLVLGYGSHDIRYIIGLAGNAVLDRQAEQRKKPAKTQFDETLFL